MLIIDEEPRNCIFIYRNGKDSISLIDYSDNHDEGYKINFTSDEAIKLATSLVHFACGFDETEKRMKDNQNEWDILKRKLEERLKHA